MFNTFQALRPLVIVGGFFSVGQDCAVAGERPTLTQAVAGSLQGNHVKGVPVGRHQFNLKPVGTDGSGKKSVESTATTLSVRGSFQHDIVGKNDVVYYWILLERGMPPRGVITGIKYRGLRFNPGIKIVSGVLGAVIPGVGRDDLLDAVDGVQKWRVGSWEQSAQKIVDEMARQLAELF